MQNQTLSTEVSTQIAQKILSCIYWMKTAAYPERVLKSLRGEINVLISTNGALQGYSQKTIKQWITQLVNDYQFLELTPHKYLVITKQGAAFLKEKKKITLRKPFILTPYTRHPEGYKMPREPFGPKMRVRPEHK